MNEFQYRFQKSFAASKLTASELSKRTGISEANISNYINGKYIPKQDKCYALARALDVDPWWLMTGEEPTSNRIEMPVFIPDSQKFVEVTRHMHPDDYRMVMEAYERTYKKMKEKGLIDW